MKYSNIFRVDKRPISTKSNTQQWEYYITWPSITMTKQIYQAVVKWARASHDYSTMSSDTFERISKNFKNLYNCDITADQIRSIRSATVKEKIIFGYKRMNENIEKISADYTAGKSIVELSRQYDFPPINLLRGIFIHKGVSKGMVYRLFNEKKSFNEVIDQQDTNATLSTPITDRDREQYQMAIENDAESAFNQQIIDQLAMENENIVVDYFKSLGIGIITQEQLVEEQVKEHGRALLTPDILFTDPVYINNTLVRWIDYKDYAGTLIKFLRTSNIAQAKKYTDKWGAGALCFHQSFIEGMIIPGAMLLDARTLPIKLKLYPQVYIPPKINNQQLKLTDSKINGQGDQKKKSEENEPVIGRY